MATGDTLKKLVASYQTRNDDAFRGAVLRLIAEERQRNHHALAHELERLLELDSGGRENTQLARGMKEIPRDRERQTLLIEVRTPHRTLTEVVLDDETRTSLEETIDEYRHEEILRSYGLKPKSKLLFYGPPGNGKTLCAEVFANELGLPLLYARFDGLVSSYLGETAANLRKVFDYASIGRWVLFFDEFDAVGRSRDDLGEHGELKRVVNSFLQLLDSFTTASFFIAATNHESLLDTALWRRFDDVVYFGPPDRARAYVFIESKLSAFRHPRINLERFASEVSGLSYADIEHICTEAIKRCILNGADMLDTATLTNTLNRFRRRLQRIEAEVQYNHDVNPTRT